MTLKNLGLLEWTGKRDMDLHRTYNVKFLIETDDIEDGPQLVTYALDLPNVGDPWTYGNDNDQYAVCTPIVQCETVLKRESNFWWILSYEFTTRPWLACLTDQLTNPISQPDYISGSFVTYQERTCKKLNGDGSVTTGTGSGTYTSTSTSNTIISSSLEPIWVSKDKNRPTVSISQTRASLGLSIFSQMIDTLNDSTLWGLPPRCIKLRNVPWKRMVWGRCNYYYQRTLEFDINYKTFDETELRDQGHRVIDKKKLELDPYLDRTNPDNFTRACDERGNINKIVLLNGQGEMCTDPTNHEHFIPTVQLYEESNFLILGVPATL